MQWWCMQNFQRESIVVISKNLDLLEKFLGWSAMPAKMETLHRKAFASYKNYKSFPIKCFAEYIISFMYMVNNFSCYN